MLKHSYIKHTVALAFAIGIVFPSALKAYAVIDLDPSAPSGEYLSLSSTSTAPKAASLEEGAPTTSLVDVRYKKKGHFLALIPVDLDVEVRAHADGELEVIYPWYTFLTINDQDQMKTELRVAIDNALHTESLGSVRATGPSTNPQWSAKEAETVRVQILKVLNGEFDSRQ